MEEYYKTIHLLRYEFKYSSDSVESMLPWELDVELSMIASSIQKEIQAKKKMLN